MKSQFTVLAAAVAISTLGRAWAIPVTVDAGGGWVALEGASYTNVSSPLSVKEDKSAWSRYLGATIDISRTIGIRIGYSRLSRVRTLAVYENQPNVGGIPSFLPLQYDSEIYVATAGVKLFRRLDRKTQLFVAPELSWVEDHQQLRAVYKTWTAPAYKRTQESMSLGGAAGAHYKITERIGGVFSYRYVGLKSSWSRKAHEISIALTFNFGSNHFPEPTPGAVH